MENQVFLCSPFFEKHIKALIKQRFKDEVEVLTDSSDKTLNLLAKKTKKCNIEKRECPIILTHADGSKYKEVRKLSKKVRNKLKNKSEWTGSKIQDITGIPTIVRRGLYEIGNIIGNKGRLAKILGEKDYMPKTINLKCSDNLAKDLLKIWKKNKFGKSNPVILKPSIGQEQRGIGVCAEYIEAAKHIKKVIEEYPNYLDWEIQQYIYKPLSIKGSLLFPGLRKETSIPLKESGGETRIIKSQGFYKCHIRAYALIVYMKDTDQYSVYLYRKFKFNSAREPYSNDLLNDNLNNIDFSNPWPHKSGGTEGGAMSLDFNELIDYLEEKGMSDCIIPKISKENLKTNITKQVKHIMKDVIKTAIKEGNCCKPTANDIDTALCVYHTVGADLLIDHTQKVWFIEANPGVGYSLIPGDVMTVYKNQENILRILDGQNNFNARLYNLIRTASKKNNIGNITGFGGLSERYFNLYQVIVKLEEKYHNINFLRNVLKNENETRNLQKKISQITKKRGNFVLQKDIEIIRDTKIPLNYSEKTGKDYLEYIRNCRFYWRHFYIERILELTLDKLVESKFRHRYQSKSEKSIYYDNQFDLIFSL